MDNYNRIRHRLTALNTGGKTMHLIRGIPDHIEDLENGRTYYYSEGLPEYATGDTMTSVTVTPWGGDEATELAFGDDASRLWQHLESLLKFDADKAPQPAPVEMPHTWQIGDTVWRHTSTHAYEGKVIEITGDLYRVEFADAPPGGGNIRMFSYAELSDIPY